MSNVCPVKLPGGSLHIPYLVTGSVASMAYGEPRLTNDIDTPFDHSRFAHARLLRPTESYIAAFASAEDVIIKKMEYYQESGSEKHLRDITGMLKVSGGEIDEAYILTSFPPNEGSHIPRNCSRSAHSRPSAWRNS